MATNSYVTLETGTAPDQLIYDEHKPTDRPVLIATGQTVTRGDLLYLASEGAVTSEATAGEANVGNGTLTATFDPAAGDPVAETYTATYDGTAWDFSGSVSGALAQDQATGLNIDLGAVIVDIVAGTIAFDEDDVFTFTVTKTGNIVARKATALTNIDTNAEGCAIAAESVTVAADTPSAPSFAYVQGVFNSRAVGNLATVAGGSTADRENLISTLQSKGIILKEAEL